MAFDPAVHTIDHDTGFLIDKKLGHRVGLDSTPTAPPDPDQKWPKWVIPHDDHIVRGENVPPVTPVLGECAVRRGDGQVSVLVNNSDEEALALEAPKEAAPPELQPDQQRVVGGQNDLTEKIRNLAGFIAGEVYDKLPVDEQNRLTRQWLAMKDYAAALSERIIAFPSAKGPAEPKASEPMRGARPEEQFGLDYGAKHLAGSPKEETVEPQVPTSEGFQAPTSFPEPNPAPTPPEGV